MRASRLFLRLVVASALLGVISMEVPGVDSSLASGAVTSTYAVAGYNHGCEVMSDGTVRCWGSNLSGQLGNGTTTASTTAVEVAGISDAVKVDVNTGNGDSIERGCALLGSGQTKCWGVNYSSARAYLGTGDTVSVYKTPVPVCVSGSTLAGDCVPLANGIDLSLDGYGGCVVTSSDSSTTADNRVYCWGYGYTGNNAYPVCTSGNVATSDCVEFSGAVSVSSETGTRCSMTGDGRAFCWGANAMAQLGDGTTTTRTTAAPVKVGGVVVSDVIDIATASNTTCMVRGPGGGFTINRIMCVGGRYWGQVGDGLTSSALSAGASSYQSYWDDICGYTRTAPTDGVACSTTTLPGSATKIVAGTTTMCAYIPNGYGTGDDGWSCWGAGSDYLGRPNSSTDGGTSYTTRNFIGQICTAYNTISAAGECSPGFRFSGSPVGLQGSTNCAVSAGTTYCWGMKAGGSIPGATGAGNFYAYPYAIGLGSSMRTRTPIAGTEPATPFTTQPVIQLVAANGTESATSGVTVTAALSSVSGSGVLSGTTTATTDASGRATFTDLQVSAAGTYTISFTATSYGAAAQTVRVATLTSRTISIDGGSYQSTYAGDAAPPTLTSTASAGAGAKTYSTSTPAVCSVNSASGLVSFLDNGTCSVSATIASDGTYVLASSSTVSITITEVARTISVDSSSYGPSYQTDQTGPTLTSTLSAGAGLRTYTSSTTGVCTVNPSTGAVQFVSAGTCTLAVAVAATGVYASASSSTVSFLVATPTAGTVAPLATTTTVASQSSGATTTTVALSASNSQSGSSSPAVDGDLATSVSESLSITGLWGSVTTGDGSVFTFGKNGSVGLKIRTGYIGSASGSVKATYKVAGKSRTWSCAVPTAKIGKVNPKAKRSSGNWFPRKNYALPNKCILPVELRTALRTQSILMNSKVRFVKLWPTTGKAVNAETGARIPVGIRTVRITLGG